MSRPRILAFYTEACDCVSYSDFMPAYFDQRIHNRVIMTAVILLLLSLDPRV